MNEFRISLKLFRRPIGNLNETIDDETMKAHYSSTGVKASIVKGGVVKEYKLSDVPNAEKLEKYLEDVK